MKNPRINTTHKPLDHWKDSRVFDMRQEQSMFPPVKIGKYVYRNATCHLNYNWMSLAPDIKPIDRPLPEVPDMNLRHKRIQIVRKQTRKIARRNAAALIRQAEALLRTDSRAWDVITSYHTDDYTCLNLRDLANELDDLE